VTVIHLGRMARQKGWPQLLEALSVARAPGLRAWLVGSFADNSETEFHARVAGLGLSGRVIAENWMPFADAYRRVLAADIGIVSLQPGSYNHTLALPHKLFDYMVAGLPVIAPAFAREVAEIVGGNECGLLVDTSNPRAIAEALDRLARDPEERDRLGANGRKAVLERYNWERESEKLVGMYQELARETGSSSKRGASRDCCDSIRCETG
jgi:glycosyltransferase involved in cell wall biosynthesis